MQTPISLADARNLEESLVAGDCCIFVNNRRSAIGNAEMMVANIEKIPQPCTLDMFHLSSNRLGIALVQVEFCRNTHGMARQLP